MKLYKIQNTRIIVVDEIFATHQVYRDFDNFYDEIDKNPYVARVHIFIPMIADNEIYDSIRYTVNKNHNHHVTIHSRKLIGRKKRHYINSNIGIKNKFRVDGSGWMTFSLGNGYYLDFRFDKFGFIGIEKSKHFS